MKGPIRDVDAQRTRWITYRREQGLVHAMGNSFAQSGLGGFVEDLTVRFLFLPADPGADAMPLNAEILGWLREERPNPYGGGQMKWGHRTRATSSALVIYDQYRDDRGWDSYLAVHRHGGVEFGSGRSIYQVGETRVFALRQIVGLAWSALAIQAEAIERSTLEPPFELTVALRDTKDATLGSFAEGWKEPGHGMYDMVTCIEDHVLLRWELDQQPVVEDIALEVGDRIEQAFGTSHRRHLAHRGQYEGRFDPRFGF